MLGLLLNFTALKGERMEGRKERAKLKTGKEREEGEEEMRTVSHFVKFVDWDFPSPHLHFSPRLFRF